MQQFIDRALPICVALALTALLASPVAADGWPDGNPAIIWERPAGFYESNDTWYAIIHVPDTVERVRLFAISLTVKPTPSI